MVRPNPVYLFLWLPAQVHYEPPTTQDLQSTLNFFPAVRCTLWPENATLYLLQVPRLYHDSKTKQSNWYQSAPVFESRMSSGRTRALPIKLDLEMDCGDNKTELKDHQVNMDMLRVLMGPWCHTGRKITYCRSPVKYCSGSTLSG